MRKLLFLLLLFGMNLSCQTGRKAAKKQVTIDLPDNKKHGFWEYETEKPMKFKALALGDYHNSCGIREDGSATCWGNNAYGQRDAPAENSKPWLWEPPTAAESVRTAVPHAGGITIMAKGMRRRENSKLWLWETGTAAESVRTAVSHAGGITPMAKGMHRRGSSKPWLWDGTTAAESVRTAVPHAGGKRLWPRECTGGEIQSSGSGRLAQLRNP